MLITESNRKLSHKMKCCFEIAHDPVVQLPNGLIQGREAVTLKDNTYYAFEKIPYATPPVGNLRFKAPIPAKNWEGILNTTHLDITCYQQGIDVDYESEDCLFINVFTPQLPNADEDLQFPVMFYIHGGAFANGSSRYSAPDLFIDNDVVFVTINYRLGPFGFLSTQDDVIPGNNGLKDQHLAIQWTHDNINLFGGDPDKITIFGQSAGSASCAYQLLNQQSQGLFRGAILESGTAINPWAYQRRAREVAFATAALINDTFSNSNDSVALLDFLLGIDAKELKKAGKEYSDSVNADFLNYNLDAYDNHLDWLVPSDMQIEDMTNRTEMGRSIREIYTNGETFLDHFGDGIRFYSDTGFTRAIIKFAELYCKVAQTYFYQFSYDGELGANDVHYVGAEYVGHSEELRYIFCRGNGCDFSNYPISDQISSERIINIWTNFAKFLNSLRTEESCVKNFRNPTPEPSELLQNITWPLLSTDNGDFLYVDIDENLNIENHPKNVTYSKWTELYNSL
ncbi:COesterase and/or Abhydrolase 3 domain containing protein, partial [Asbolus verrucosus]